MKSIENLRKLSFLVYGLGLTGKSVVNFLREMKLKIILYGMIKIRIYIKKKELII